MTTLLCVTMVTPLPIVAAIAIHCKALHTQSHHGTAAITTKGREAAMNTARFHSLSLSLTLPSPPSPSPTKIAAMQRPSTPPCAHSPRHCSDDILLWYIEWRRIGRWLTQCESSLTITALCMAKSKWKNAIISVGNWWHYKEHMAMYYSPNFGDGTRWRSHRKIHWMMASPSVVPNFLRSIQKNSVQAKNMKWIKYIDYDQLLCIIIVVKFGDEWMFVWSNTRGVDRSLIA